MKKQIRGDVMAGISKPYSDFLRVDLHIHTDMSKRTKANDYKGNFSIQAVYSKMLENRVGIFSLTDHNIINIDAYAKYYSTYNGEEDPLLLIGVELDIDVVETRYHSLIIFCHHDVENLNRISESLEKYYREKGYELTERQITLDDIVSLFPTDDFFFIPHAGNGSNSLVDAYSHDIPYAQKMLLLMPSCALEKVKQKAVAHYNNSFGRQLTEAQRDRNDIAYIQFSDNHNIEAYPKTHKGKPDNPVHEFYYVKGGKNYETLRQAFIDPVSRIKSESELATLPRNQNYLEGLKISGSEKIEDTHLVFSPHLNVIIGGRSSGKSLLMSLFGKCIDRLPENDTYDDLLTTATVQTKTQRESAYSNKSTLAVAPIWIRQGDIIRYFEQLRLDELAHKVGKNQERDTARQHLINKRNELQDEINRLVNTYRNVHERLNERSFVLHDQTITESLSDEYTVRFDKEEIIGAIGDSTELLDEAEGQFEVVLESIKALKENDFITFTDEESQLIENFEQMIQGKQQHYRNKGLLSRRQNTFIDCVEKTLETKNREIGNAAEDKATAIRTISSIAAGVKDRLESAATLLQVSERLSNLSCHETEEFDLHGDTKFVVEAISEITPCDALLDAIRGAEETKSLYLNLLGLVSGQKTVKNLGGNDPDVLSRKLGTVFSLLYDCYNKPEESLKYGDNSTSKGNSPGYNSEKYLEILLSQADSNLVFIDQPEDNLGNNFIAETLVRMIREQKFKGQVFLVTHNPAIVVYGDAESIIIATNDNQRISYRQIVLEDRQAQKEVCRILDGGEYIFDRRAKKYNIKRILTEAGQDHE
jgi:predicted ATP-dependent endonuclease of OLD family